MLFSRRIRLLSQVPINEEIVQEVLLHISGKATPLLGPIAGGKAI
jgi:hypothetical protein